MDRFFEEKNVEGKGHSKGGICRIYCKNQGILLYFEKSKKQKIKKLCKNPTKNRWKKGIEKRRGSRTKFHRFWVDFGSIFGSKGVKKQFQKGIDF